MNFNRAFAARNLRRDTIELYFSRVLPNRSTVEYVTNVIVEQFDAHSSPVGVDEPGIRLEREAAQQLMDDLWSAGIRSTYAKAGDDLIEALRAHVTDSQKVRDKLLSHFLLSPLLRRPRIKRDRS